MDTAMTDYESDAISEIDMLTSKSKLATQHANLDDEFSFSNLSSDLQQETEYLDTDFDLDEDEDMSFETASQSLASRPRPTPSSSLIMPAPQPDMIDIYHRPNYNTSSTLLYRAPKKALVSLSRTCHHRLVTLGHPMLQFAGGDKDIYRYALRWIARVAKINESDNNASELNVELGAKTDGLPIPYSGAMPILTLLKIKALAGEKRLDCPLLAKVCELEIPKFVKSNGISVWEMEVTLEYAERGELGWGVVVDFVAKEVFEQRMKWDHINGLEGMDGAEGFGDDVREAVEVLRSKKREDWPMTWEGHKEFVKKMEHMYPAPTKEKMEELKEEAAQKWDPKMAYPEEYFNSKGKGKGKGNGKMATRDTKDAGEEEAFEIPCWYRGELLSVAEVEKRQREEGAFQSEES